MQYSTAVQVMQYSNSLVLIFRVFLSTPAPTLPHKKISKNGQESQFHINSSHVLWFWQNRQTIYDYKPCMNFENFLNIHIKFAENVKKWRILSVSESGSVPEIWDLSVGRTDTVSVSVYTTFRPFFAINFCWPTVPINHQSIIWILPYSIEDW